MKKILIYTISALLIFSVTACIKSEDPCSPKAIADEEPQIIAYTATNNINATRHNSGVYYEVVNQGSGVAPNANSKVYVTYTGKLLNGTVFETVTNSAATGWVLGQLITGWQIGLPLLQEGGTIKLIIPSSLAYGCQAVGPIPANSVLYFEITLVDVE